MLAFSGSWRSPGDDTLRGLRAELSGLGVALLMFAPGCSLLSRADEQGALAYSVEQVDRAAFEALLSRAVYLARPAAPSPGALELAVLNTELQVYWHGQAVRCHDPVATVARGLAIASRELEQRNGRSSGSSRCAQLTTLTSGLGLTLGEADRPALRHVAPVARCRTASRLPG